MGNPLGPPGPGPAPGVTTVAGLSDVTAVTTFSPTASFGTPGDLSIVYGVQNGRWGKIGALTFFYLQITTTTFTFTTASGQFIITVPFTVQPGGRALVFPAAVGGVKFPGTNSYIQGWAQSANGIALIASNSGGAVGLADNTYFTSGTNLNISMQGIVF